MHTVSAGIKRLNVLFQSRKRFRVKLFPCITYVKGLKPDLKYVFKALSRFPTAERKLFDRLEIYYTEGYSLHFFLMFR